MTSTLENSIAEALEFYRMGDLGLRDTCFIEADLRYGLGAMVRCEVRRNGQVKECEFLRSIIRIQFDSLHTALIEIPKCFLPIFCLWDFVLKPKELEGKRRQVAMYNAPYLPPETRRPLETVGRIRI